MRRTQSVSGTVWKGLIIAETIICYLACLAVVSYIHGPERYRAAADVPLLKTEEFTTFAGAAVEAGGALPLENAVPGEAVGYMAWLRLSELKQIQISFQMECPAKFAGGTLSIDLYNFETGYDNPEQEYQLTVQEGHSEIAFQLTPGDSPPEGAYLRFFTLDPAGYQLKDIQIYCGELLPQVPTGLWVGTGLCFLLLAGTVSAWTMSRKNREKRPA